MTAVRFTADRKQIVARALLLALCSLAVAFSLVYIGSAGSPEDRLLRYGPGPIAVVGLSVGALVAVHSAFGLLTDLGVLPRLLITETAEVVRIANVGARLAGHHLSVARGSSVSIRSNTRARGGALTPGYRVAIGLTSGDSACTLMVTTGEPQRALEAVAAAIARHGLRVEPLSALDS